MSLADGHSLSSLGRELTIFKIKPDYPGLVAGFDGQYGAVARAADWLPTCHAGYDLRI